MNDTVSHCDNVVHLVRRLVGGVRHDELGPAAPEGLAAAVVQLADALRDHDEQNARFEALASDRIERLEKLLNDPQRLAASAWALEQDGLFGPAALRPW